jgi:hypothetical protein
MKIKQIRQKDGTTIHFINIDGVNKFHNWDGPALIPQGNTKLAEYYLYGIKYSKDKWHEVKKESNGLPWFKASNNLDNRV